MSLFEEFEIRPLERGDRAWFKIMYYENTNPAGSRERWRECFVEHVHPNGLSLLVRWYETPHNEVRKTIKTEDLSRYCEGDPLFSC